MVLKSPDMPSLLIETGFISNPTEAKNLASSNYQSQLASSIFTGIKRYFESRPPAGTLIASLGSEGNRTHVIQSGDTLSIIAQRYNVSLESLREINNIQGSLIQVGQRLRIPAS
jgi:N-acetylmuramoyl-L-alanine amidase